MLCHLFSIKVDCPIKASYFGDFLKGHPRRKRSEIHLRIMEHVRQKFVLN